MAWSGQRARRSIWQPWPVSGSGPGSCRVAFLTVDPDSGYEVTSVLLESQLGNVDAVARHLESMEKSARTVSHMPQHLGEIVFATAFADFCGAGGDLDGAVRRAELILGSDRPIPAFMLFAQAALGVDAVERHSPAGAERVYKALLPYAGTMGAWFPLAVDHLLGLLARTMGRSDAAISYFDAALAFCSNGGLRPAYGWVAADYAAHLRERNVDGDHARGVALQNEALAIGRELGMRPLVERVLARREILNA